MSHWHPESAGSDEFLRFFLLACLIVVATIFELLSHHITHVLQHKAHEHSHDSSDEPVLFRAQMSLKLWVRAQAELTVLGFLALIIWVLNRATILDMFVDFGTALFASTAEDDETLAVASAVSHLDAPEPGYCFPGKLSWLPPSGESLVHILEDVHSTSTSSPLPSHTTAVH